MSHEPKVTLERRNKVGTAESRRLRTQGKVPCNVYGHGEEPVAVTVCAEAIRPVLLAGSHVVDLDLDGKVQKAVIRDVQWDTWFTHLIHVDFQRIDADARVKIAVDVETRGVLPGGVLDHHLHTVELDCPAYLVPEKLYVKIGTLAIGDVVTISQLELPVGVKATLPGDTVVVRVNEARTVEIVQAEQNAAGPEVIGRKKTDEEEGT